MRHYSIFERLIGQKHADQVAQDQRSAAWVSEQLRQISTGESKAPPSILKLLIKEMGRTHGPEMAKAFQDHFDQLAAEEGLNKKRAMMAQSAPTPQAPPAMPQQTGGPPQFSPVSPAMRAQAGLPQPPFDPGAPAPGGPPPLQNENPAVKTASIAGTLGFGGPAAATAPAPTRGSMLYVGPEQEGINNAAAAAPGMLQANRLGLQHAQALYEQTQAQKIAEQHRIMAAIEADPAWDKANPLQKNEIRMHVMGIPGAVSNYVQPRVMPRSIIKGSDFPPDSLTNQGTPIDPSKWYLQQPDPATGEIRGVQTTPTLSKTRVLTEAGPVVAFTDPAGEFVHAINEINGSPITDPRLLETVRTSLENRTITTVGKDGKPINTIVQVPGYSASQKVLPGKGKPGAPARHPLAPPAALDGAPGAAPGATANGGRIVATFPKPLTAATQGAAEFAQTIQQHTSKIDNLIDQLDKDGQLGVIASRWNDFMAGKVGAGDPRFSALQTNLGLFATALGRAHQTRGIQIMEHFQQMANAGKLTAETLRSNFAVLKDWVNTYANMGSNRPGALDTGGASPSAIPPPPRRPLAEHFK
jgi:hypothetical protein